MITTVSSVILVTVVLAFWFRLRKPRLPHPPSPPAHPILGNLKALPKEYNEDAYRKLAEKYGGIVYLNIMGKPTVIINSEKVANDLLDKRSVIYSDRPPLPFHHMTGLANTLTFLPYGTEFLKTRKMVQDQLTRKKCTLFEDIELAQRNILLQNLLASPANFATHVKMFAFSVVLKITYGHNMVSGDEFLKNSDVLEKMIGEAGGAGQVLLDFIPILRHVPPWFPGAWFSKFAHRIRPLIEELKEYGVDLVERNVSSGNAQVSFASLHLEDLNSEERKSKEELERLKWASFTFWTAGGGTTWSSLEGFFLAMVLHPEAQTKAQKELDTVLGHGELPGFEDRDNLPYLNCSLILQKRSLLRHIDLSRHMLTREDIYHRPSTFLPERFLPKPDGFEEPLPSAVFGFGRRICPGRWLAQSEMWIAIASILSMFDIRPIQNERGEDVLPPPEFHVSLTRCGHFTFDCDLLLFAEKVPFCEANRNHSNAVLCPGRIKQRHNFANSKSPRILATSLPLFLVTSSVDGVISLISSRFPEVHDGFLEAARADAQQIPMEHAQVSFDL
ncbi:hypothetical protein NLI96_g4620 [Meripilus lineatus]|uniref:Cytochrome P450 n=1 Tax=Meripilus lineatus TaxID=2056292 RepID=A0AAD5V9J0_9APHY|nr:hypothetical protein NLI96_g4620 [Physisporinus lineatus]